MSMSKAPTKEQIVEQARRKQARETSDRVESERRALKVELDKANANVAAARAKAREIQALINKLG